MLAEDVKAIIANEIKSESNLKNVYGLDLTTCIIEPIKQKYQDTRDANKLEELWTVLEETPDGNGYKICYDEESKTFGLGIKSDNGVLINIGYYGTFLESLYAM